MPATNASGAPESAAARSCGAAWSIVTTQNPSNTAFLYSVDGVATNDVWAVGDWSEQGSLVQTQTQHWNGTSWNIVPSPSPGTIGASLGGVDAISPNNAWAVGDYIDDEDASRTLVERWNGSAWTVVPSPNQGDENNVLSDVAAVGPSDVWAVGNYLDAATGNYRTLSLHWNGATWTVVPSPSVGTGENNLTEVAARSADDVWAVGYRFDPAVAAFKTLILHWNGSAWSVVTSPNPAPSGDNQLFGVTALSATDAWAVGYHRAADVLEALIVRWNGTAWTVSPSPDPGTIDNQLFGIAALAGGDAWAVGTYATNAVREPLAEHWDGLAWSVASTPAVGSGNGSFVTILLSDLTVVGSQVWAVGYRSVPGVGIQTLAERLCPVQVLDSGFSPKTVTVTHGQTVAWSLPATNDQSHSVADKTGMGLFDSGARAPGSSFTFTFAGAGTYPVIDEVTSNTGTVKSKMTASPPSGGPGTQFTIAWASATPPAGFVFDVQIRRPGSGGWVDWKKGVTTTSSVFVPDGGAGTYSFRARLRKTSDGSSSNWSPGVSIQVI